MTSPITNFFKKLGKQTDVVKRIEKAFTSISHVFRYMILRMAFRQAIKNFNTFFGKLLEFSEKTADAFNVLYNAIVKLQVTVTAMVAPFIQAFGSILAGIVSKIIEFINYFNQLTSALFNNSETYIRAKDTALDYRDALDKTGKAANKVLAPFDQINQLGKAGGSGSGGLFDNLNPNDLFEEAPVDKSIKSLSDRIKEAFKDKTFFDGFDSFTFMSNLMNKLQSYLDTDTAATLGIFAGSFVNWIVRGIDGFITTWEPEGTANFLITFCEKFAEKLDATSLKNVAKTLLTKLATFFGTIASSLRDSNIGVDAGEWLNDILPAAADLSYSLGQLLGAAIGQVADFINTTDSQKLVDVIVAFVDGATETEN